jgi:hypothetical protein
LADSATSGSYLAATRIGTLQVKNLSTTNALAKDTMTVTMTGAGYLEVTAPSATTGRSFIIANAESFTADVALMEPQVQEQSQSQQQLVHHL